MATTLPYDDWKTLLEAAAALVTDDVPEQAVRSDMERRIARGELLVWDQPPFWSMPPGTGHFVDWATGEIFVFTKDRMDGSDRLERFVAMVSWAQVAALYGVDRLPASVLVPTPEPPAKVVRLRRRGRKKGIQSPKDKCCKMALELLKSDEFKNGADIVARLAQRILADWPELVTEDYQQDTIEGYIRDTVKEYFSRR